MVLKKITKKRPSKRKKNPGKKVAGHKKGRKLKLPGYSESEMDGFSSQLPLKIMISLKKLSASEDEEEAFPPDPDVSPVQVKWPDKGIFVKFCSFDFSNFCKRKVTFSTRHFD
jgi:hypothetical protein